MAEYLRSLHSRPTGSNAPRLNTTRQTWTNNGVEFTVETSGFSTGSFGMSSNSPRRTQSNQPRSNGMLGAAFGLLGDVLAVQQQQQQQAQRSRRRSQQPYIEDDLAYGDDEDVIMREERARKPRGLVSKFAERLANNAQRTRKVARSREQSPAYTTPRRPRTDARARLYRTQEREPVWADTRHARVNDTSDEDDYDSEEDGDDHYLNHAPRPSRSQTYNDAEIIKALEKEVARNRRGIRSCQKTLGQASRHPNVDANLLQEVVNDMKDYEHAHAIASEELENAKAVRDSRSSGRSVPPQPQHTQLPMPTEHVFTSNSVPGFEAFFSTGTSSHPLFSNFHTSGNPAHYGGSPFGAFGAFNQMLNDDFFFGMPRAAFPTFSNQSVPQSGFYFANAGPQQRQTPASKIFTDPTPKPPPNMLKPDEAKKLFTVYNERWNALAPVDPAIPYPCRGLQSGALSARDMIWAPLVSSPISAWSEETVMQANTQAFFVGAAGLTPQYTEAPGTGSIVMGFDKLRASPGHVKNLIDMLKKEKIRWHSDRLGRRNGGASGAPNEALQRDERARAVFHAVCELMEFAQ